MEGGAKQQTEEETLQLIIDTDAGIDDAASLIFALFHSLHPLPLQPGSPDPRVVEVRAITTVFGNVDVEQATENVARILELFPKASYRGQPIPFYQGAAGPLITPEIPLQRWEGHGTNGLGGHLFADEPTRKPEKEVAAVGLINLINANPGAYTLLFLGPMTNLALAVRLDPSIVTKVKKLIFMGGTSQGKGNSSLCAEFNVFADPEAAQIVLDAFKTVPIYMVSWELTVEYSFQWDWYRKWIKTAVMEEAETKRQYGHVREFLRNITIKFEELANGSEEEEGKQTEGQVGFPFVMCDTFALFVALFPSVITKEESYYVTVELEGRWGRGTTAIDWYAKMRDVNRNVHIVMSLDAARVVKLWESLLTA